MKKILSCLLVGLCLLFVLVGCDSEDTTEKSITGIYDINIEAISEPFYAGADEQEFDLYISSTETFDISQINIVVEDPDVLYVYYHYNDFFFDEGHVIRVKGKSPGVTSFYIETSDSVVKSDTIEVEVKSNVAGITLSETEDVIFTYSWSKTKDIYFDVSTNYSTYKEEELIEFISENPEIATFEFKDTSWSYDGQATITSVNPGETYVYIKAKDSDVQSEKIKVIVEKDEDETEIFTHESSHNYYSDSSSSENSSESSTGSSGLTNTESVWIPQSGSKYHSSSSCSGMKNPSQVTKSQAEASGYTACKRCW